MMRSHVVREEIRHFKTLGLLGDIYRQAVQMRKDGQKLMPLNLGDPAQFDFPVLPSFKQGIQRALEKPTNYAYGSPQGYAPLVETIAQIERVDPRYVFIGNGISDMMDKLFNATAVTGTNVLLPAPVFTAYLDLDIRNKVESRLYPCDPRTWQPVVPGIASRLDDNTSMLFVNSPNNPTGAVYTEEVLRGIIDLAHETNVQRKRKGVAPLVVIFDEVYKELWFEREPPDVKPMLQGKELTWVILNGASKAFNVTGLRMGYAAFGGLEADALREAMYNQCIVPLCVNHVFQEGWHAALTDPGKEAYFALNRAKLKARRDLMLRAFAKMPGVEVVKPEGAFYMIVKMDTEFDSDLELGMALLKEEKLCTSQVSSFFDEQSKPKGTMLRFVILPPEELLTEAMGRLENFLRRHARVAKG